jgi:outer membrane lipoprotein-sorting protein
MRAEMRSPVLATCLLAALQFVPAFARAQAEDAVPAGDPKAINACVAKNFPAKTSIQTLSLKATDRIGSERTIRAVVHWKRADDGKSKVRALFSEPLDIAGSALLMLQTSGPTDVFLYTPALKKTRRISSQAMKGAIYGTDFSFEDFARLQGVGIEQTLTRLPDADLDGRPVHVLEARAPEISESAYRRGVSWIDRETCVPTKVELYEVGDRLRKVLTAPHARVEKHGDSWLPHELVMVDQRDQTRTVLTVEKIEFGAAVPDRTFSLAQLERAAQKGE